MSGLVQASALVTRICAIIFFLFVSAFTAQAQTPVSGDISSNTVWRTSDSPIVVSGAVEIVNSARLTIEPGVDVLMEPSASLRVVSGGILALGTAQSPILVTSVSDVAPGEAGSPGDWGRVEFGEGTLDEATHLRHVTIRFGSGVLVEKASPRLDNVTFDSNAGPAMTIDLQSSPIGTGLAATDNEIDGVLVMPGEISGNTLWGLRGIPYIVQSGSVYIGPMTFGLVPSRLTVVRGVTAQLALNIPDPAPSGGLDVVVVSTVPSVVRAPSTVHIPQQQQSAVFQIDAESLGESIIHVSLSGYGGTASAIEVVEPPFLSVEPTESVVSMGSNQVVRIVASELSPVGGREVHVQSVPEGLVEHPDRISIPTGSASVDLEIQGRAEGLANLTVTSAGLDSAAGRVRVRPKSVNLPSSLVVSPGGTRDFPVYLTDAAPEGGVVVSLTSSAEDVLSVSPTVTVEAGSQFATARIDGLSAGLAEIVASADSYAPDTAQVTVRNIALLTLPAGSVRMPVGRGENIRVRLSELSPPGGLVVSVASSDREIVDASESQVFIPEGQIEASRLVRLSGRAVGQAQLQLGSEGLEGGQLSVEITPQPQLRLTPSWTSTRTRRVGKGLRNNSSEIQVQLFSGGTRIGAPEPVTVYLHSSDPSRVQVPESVVIPANATPNSTGVGFNITGVELTDASVEITATAEGFLPTPSPILIDVVEPYLQFNSLTGNRTTQSTRDEFSVSWRVPGAVRENYGYAYAVEDQTVHLSFHEDAPEGLVDGFWGSLTGPDQVVSTTIARGANTSSTRFVGQATTTGQYQVQAEVAGITPSQSAIQRVNMPRIVFNHAQSIVGQGLRTTNSEMRVERRVNGALLSLPEPVVVTLSCASEAVCTTPVTVTIPANQSSVAFRIAGEGVGVTRLLAQAEGYLSEHSVDVTVVQPQVRFTAINQATSMVSGGSRTATVGFTVPGAYQTTSQTAVAPIVVDLVSADPAVVSVPEMVVVQAGSSASASFTVHAGAAGSSTVTASGVGMLPVTSGQINVTPGN